MDVGLLGLEHHLVDVAPVPVLAGLERTHERVSRCREVFACMTIRLIVATADMTAGHAKAQVHPRCADSQAILAAA